MVVHYTGRRKRISLPDGRLEPRRRSPTTPKARSSASPTLPSVPSSNRRPIRVTPWGTRRGVGKVGSGLLGSGAQSLRALTLRRSPRAG